MHSVVHPYPLFLINAANAASLVGNTSYSKTNPDLLNLMDTTKRVKPETSIDEFLGSYFRLV